MRLLVTGGAGFIGGHLCQALLERGDTVWCVDNFDPFYDPAVKRRTAAGLARHPGFRLVEADVSDPAALDAALHAAGVEPGGVDAVVHLAGRAGVRPSIDAPVDYARTNVVGTAALLEAARRLGVPAFVLGSSSSVYGDTAAVPFREDDAAARPISPYAASKRGAELLAHAYAHLHGTAVVALRFFTVYGPRQRPDLAIHRFARLMAGGEPVPVFGDGTTSRDYTYVDDIVQGIVRAVEYAAAHPGCWEVVNLGDDRPVPLARLLELLAGEMGATPRLSPLPEQPGDVRRTHADIGRARALLGYEPRVGIEEGIARFVAWFRAEAGRPEAP